MPLGAVLQSLTEVQGVEDRREQGGRLCCGSGSLELFPRLCIPFRVVSTRSVDGVPYPRSIIDSAPAAFKACRPEAA
jgi:hypothetical protein